MTILVTGATGNVGRAVVRELLNAGEPVRIITRDPDKAEDLLGDRPDIVRADLPDRAAVDRALTGVDRLFLACGNHPGQVQAESTVIDAAAHARVRRLVKLSGPSPDTRSELAPERWHAQIEQHLAASGLPAVVLRPASFMSNLLAFVELVTHEGILPAPTEGARVAFVDPADVGAVGAALLLSRSPLPPAPVRVTGPAAVSYDEVAAAFARVSGRPVTFVPVDETTAGAQMRGAGLPEPLVDLLLGVYRAQRQGAFTAVSDATRIYLGRQGRTVTEFLTDHRQVLAPTGVAASSPAAASDG